MIRSFLPSFAIVVHLTIRVARRRRDVGTIHHLVPSATSANSAMDEHEPSGPLWTVTRLAGETGVRAEIVVEVARSLGFAETYFDDRQAAAIIAVLCGPPAPRAA